MTQIFSSLANTNGHDVQVDSVTKGGWILHNYLDIPNEQTERIEEIASNEHFDYCFLQEQSLVPVVEYDAFADGVKRLMEKLQKAVDSFILYETFGWGQGNYRHVEHGLDFNSHCSKTIEAYERLGDSLNLSVSPAAAVCRYGKDGKTKEAPLFKRFSYTLPLKDLPSLSRKRVCRQESGYKKM